MSAIMPTKALNVIEQEILAINTVEELEEWYKQNKKVVDKDVLGLLSTRKKQLLKEQEQKSVIEVQVVE